MKTGTKGRMVAGAADLIRRRGVNATSVREVVRHSDKPRGSISHHFPRGKQQMVEEAVAYSGREVGEPLENLVKERGAVAGLRAFIVLWRNILEDTQFEAGCSVLAVAVEQYIGDDGVPNSEVQAQLLHLAQGIFEGWQHTLSSSLRKEGVKPARARRLATLVVASVEGTVALCRAAKSSQPLDDIETELEMVLSSAIPRDIAARRE